MLLIIAGSSECAISKSEGSLRKGSLQSLDWSSGLDWWTDIFVLNSIFTVSNETSAPCRLSHDAF